MKSQWKPELLAPAKNLERLKVAVKYGADAVYVGGQKYGLRARADNFTDAELREAVSFAHANGAKVYLTLNAFLHDEDLEGLEDFCQFLESIQLDAVIVSDLGVLRRVRACSGLDIHLSTQASCLSVLSAEVWKSQGVKRLIVGRELTVEETGRIGQRANIDVEMFVHGAMCMSYSGHCTISNFTAGRDSNRGGCSQSCRFSYQLEEGNVANPPTAKEMRAKAPEAATTPFMSSKDLAGIGQIDLFFRHRICSLKIEGRMKSSFYVATTCKVYRRLIDAYAAGEWTESLVQEAQQELLAVPHREYFSGSLDSPAGPDSVFTQSEGNNTGTRQYMGIVLDTTSEHIVLRLTAPVAVGDDIEIMPFSSDIIPWKVDRLYTVLREPIRSIRQESVVCLPRVDALKHVAKLNVVRTPVL